jgi:hypothetical protein
MAIFASDTRRTLCALLLVAGLTGCGGGDSSSGEVKSSASPTPATATPQAIPTGSPDEQTVMDLRDVAIEQEGLYVNTSRYTRTIRIGCTNGGTNVICYTKRPLASPVSATWVNTAGIPSTKASDASVGYCLSARSVAGGVLTFNSVTGVSGRGCTSKRQ